MPREFGESTLALTSLEAGGNTHLFCTYLHICTHFFHSPLFWQKAHICIFARIWNFRGLLGGVFAHFCICVFHPFPRKVRKFFWGANHLVLQKFGLLSVLAFLIILIPPRVSCVGMGGVDVIWMRECRLLPRLVSDRYATLSENLAMRGSPFCWKLQGILGVGIWFLVGQRVQKWVKRVSEIHPPKWPEQHSIK